MRLLDERSQYPGRGGLPVPDGQRHGPASVARGTHVVDFLPHGAPYVPCDGMENYDGTVPGGMWMTDERGRPVSAGPRQVLRPLHVADLVACPDHGYETRLVPDAVRMAAEAGE